ncbi:hypothetical protein [Lutispora thermophila]|uniref:PilX N-terminal n=1 Tax=Lutispora thermophila DSM 19022 TaxID=1122184 RepID=A0A1M6F414_9FIRM|nr:hypothetical protein [Lutispora thermophila]SHI92421.1 hypothetical protein SAMN02745176_01806 [Lutispora thermophila DSM 19022]
MKHENKGSILVLVLLLTSVIISTSTVLLSTTVMNYKMKNINSRVKKTFYNAEGAIDEAYVIVLNYIESAIEYSYTKDNSKANYTEFLLSKCEDSKGNKGLANILKDRSNYLIYNDNNISIEANIYSKTDFLVLDIKSTCIDDKIEKKINMIYHILIPKDGCYDYTINPEDLIYIYDWKLER